MKIAKATNSKDGHKRMTLIIQFRISEEELAIAFGDLIDQLNMDLHNRTFESYHAEILANISKMEIYNHCKQLLYDKGEAMWIRSENWHPFQDEKLEFARLNILKYFPEFKTW